MSAATTKRRPGRSIDFQFVAVPSDLLASKAISATAKLLLAIVLDNSRSNRSGLCKLSNGGLGRRVGRSESEVGRHLVALEKQGLVRRILSESGHSRFGIKPLWPPAEDNRNQITVDLPAPWTEAANLPEDERYSMYLCSREWGVRREAVKRRAGGTCERCGSAPMSHVHHLTYKRRYAEPLEDLLGVCEPCHAYVHGRSDRDPKPKAPAADPFASFSVVC